MFYCLNFNNIKNINTLLMDCVFNKRIPPSTSQIYIARPSGNYLLIIIIYQIGKTFVSGLATSYSEKYDSTILENHITKKEFKAII